MRKILLSLFLIVSCGAFAQDDFGLYTSISAENKITKKWSVETDLELRQMDNLNTTTRWTIGFSADYKISKHLKASLGYKAIQNYTLPALSQEVKMKANGIDPKEMEEKATEGFWRNRHRFHLAIQGDIDLGRFNISLREKYQFTRKLKATAERTKRTYEDYDFDSAGNILWNLDDYEEETYAKTFKAKTKQTLNTRLKVEYDIVKVPIDPYVSVEVNNRLDDAFRTDKAEYTVGADWKLKKKKHVVSLFYTYQHASFDNADDDANAHIIGVGYKYKF